jgi:hypothetical protein
MDHVYEYMQKFKLSEITYWCVTESKLIVKHKPSETCEGASAYNVQFLNGNENVMLKNGLVAGKCE